jgi:hypothetical protein
LLNELITFECNCKDRCMGSHLSSGCLIYEFIFEFRGNRMMRSGGWRERDKMQENWNVHWFIFVCSLGEICRLRAKGDDWINPMYHRPGSLRNANRYLQTFANVEKNWRWANSSQGPIQSVTFSVSAEPFPPFTQFQTKLSWNDDISQRAQISAANSENWGRKSLKMRVFDWISLKVD